MVAPTPQLPDDTPIERVLFSTRIQNALRAADLKTVDEVREISDETLISLPDFGKGSLSDLRKKLGLPQKEMITRPLICKPGARFTCLNANAAIKLDFGEGLRCPHTALFPQRLEALAGHRF